MDEQFRLMCAAMAMQGFIAGNASMLTRDGPALAARAFDIADAMAAEWAKRRPQEADRIRQWTGADADLRRG